MNYVRVLCTSSKNPLLFSNIIRGRNFSLTSTRRSEELPIQEDIIKDVVPVPMQRPPLPIITSRKLAFPPKYASPRQAWVVNLDTIEELKLGLIELHPTIFGAFPRIDILHENTRWQQTYRQVNWARALTRAEKRGGGRKPWPQKGLGKARHGSVRSPLWLGGGIAHGPRGPKPYFYMLPFHTRVHGLISALSVKLAQDDLLIVDSLDIPTDDYKFLENMGEERCWGTSVLFIDDTDVMSRNIAVATNNIPQYNMMPVYGLNVYSMLKHETLVLTLAAVEKIEQKLLFHLNRLDSIQAGVKFHYDLRPAPPPQNF